MVDFFTGLQPLEPGETDPAALIDRVRALDASEAIDRVLVGYSSIWPHNHATAPFTLALTDKFSPIVAHRPGVMAPVAAARYFATLDVLARGRLAINVVTGGSDKDLHRESDHTPKAERYSRGDRVPRRRAADLDRRLVVRPPRHLLRRRGGQNPGATRPGPGTDLHGRRERRRRRLRGPPRRPLHAVGRAVRRHEGAHRAGPGRRGRLRPRASTFSLSLRLFVGDTDDEAWARPGRPNGRSPRPRARHGFLRSSATDNSVGRQRALALTEERTARHCFWTGLTKLLGGFANSQALVGTEERILDAGHLPRPGDRYLPRHHGRRGRLGPVPRGLPAARQEGARRRDRILDASGAARSAGCCDRAARHPHKPALVVRGRDADLRRARRRGLRRRAGIARPRRRAR